mgnify:CR=1 FL=1
MKRGKFEAAKPSRKPTAAQKHTGGSAPKKSGGGKKVGILVGCVLLVAVLCVCAYGMILKGQDTIYPNVYVAGINVGGLKRDAAIHAVQEAVDQHTSADTLTVVLPDRSLSFTPEVSQVALNADEAVDQALQYGRSGGPITALITYNRAKHNEYNVDLESSLNLDTDYIRSLIDQTARDVESDRIDPIVKVDEDAGTITVTAGSPAIHLDADALYDAVIQRFTTGNFSDLSFDYDTTPCDPVDLQSYYDKYCTDTVDAYYDEEAKKLVPEEVGYGFDLAYYTQQIAMAKAGEVITIQMEDREPEVTLKTLEKEFFSDVLGQCDSPHTADANRTTNLELACKAIVTGENLGQVASQTMEAMACTQDVTHLPVLQPLIGMDKRDIVKIAREIGTFDTSILPYEDCCTVFTPRHPKTRPTVAEVAEAESALDIDALVHEAVDGIERIRIDL